ncbi:hypothetical protein RhiirA4_428222, partial [Rhizophagus irregularis]
DGLGLQILALKNATNVPFPFFSLGMYSDITGLKISVLEDGLGLQILALKNVLGYYWTQDFGFGVSICIVCCFFFFFDWNTTNVPFLFFSFLWGRTWIPDFGFEAKNKRA